MCEEGQDVFEEILESEPEEELGDEEEEKNEEPLVSAEEDRQLQERYGIAGGYKGFEPNLSNYDWEQIRKGRDSYDAYRRRQYATKTSFYSDDLRRLRAKRQFRRDMDEAFDGIENLSKLTKGYDDLIENHNNPAMAEMKHKIREQLEGLSEDEAKKIADDLLERKSISPEGYEYILENLIKK